MILVTGPTGSGKTTTLYGAVKVLNKRSVNISTIEDPVEYHIKNISQTQVNEAKGYTFASGLRSIMRQDPDVILIGETFYDDEGARRWVFPVILAAHFIVAFSIFSIRNIGRGHD